MQEKASRNSQGPARNRNKFLSSRMQSCGGGSLVDEGSTEGGADSVSWLRAVFFWWFSILILKGLNLWGFGPNFSLIYNCI